MFIYVRIVCRHTIYSQTCIYYNIPIQQLFYNYMHIHYPYELLQNALQKNASARSAKDVKLEDALRL